MNPISGEGLARFDGRYSETEKLDDADAVLVRSASMKEIELPGNLKAVARAGAGVNNIPLEKCAAEGIVVFNTPGANANGVKELVIAGLLLASRDIIGGAEWVRGYDGENDIAKQTEKEKKRFAGCELAGKKLGVIGLGAIGALVANAAVGLGMEVYGYDPYLSVDTAWKLSREIHHAASAEEIYQSCDYITVHVPAADATKGMIDREAFAQMREGVALLNFSRDVIVEEQALKEALAGGRVKRYVTDFPNEGIRGVEGTIILPHLGASTEESEENCARMAADEVRDFLENGNITHSVNYPDCSMGTCTAGARITILHRNIPNMIGQFTAHLAAAGMNISDMANKSRGEYAYTMIDVDNRNGQPLEELLAQVGGVLRVRVIE